MGEKLPDLSTANAIQWLEVFSRVLALAALDQAANAPRRTGSGLRLQVGKMRMGHHRMLTTVYNQFRDELGRARREERPSKEGLDIRAER